MAQILLIEPDLILAMTARKFLENLGHEVHWRADAQSAINSADETAPDVVVMELQLAQHSGMEFLFEFRSYPEWQRVPIIVISDLPPKQLNISSPAWKQLDIAAYFYKPKAKLVHIANAIDKAVEQPSR